MTHDPESVDLLALTRRLANEGSRFLAGGFHEGKTSIRDRTVALLGCSELEAENLVDTLIAQGFLRFRSSPEGPGIWELILEIP